MNTTSTDLYSLMDRLKKCPIEFLQPSILKPPGTVHTVALVLDLFRKVSGTMALPTTSVSLEQLKTFNQNQLIATHMGCWFFWQELFFNDASGVQAIDLFLMKELPALSMHVNYQKYIDDDERCEEFVRLALRCCHVVPGGETQQEAEDKFAAINTIKRLAVLKETNEALERMKAIKKKMEEDAAREAANVYNRE